MTMFCYQCEQTAKGTGCTVQGVCGKGPEAAALQDLLVHATKGLAMYCHRARQLGVKDREIDVFVLEALFSAVTNVDFDPARLESLVRRAASLRDRARGAYEAAARQAGETPEELGGPAQWQAGGSLEELIRQGEQVGVLSRRGELGDDLSALQELLTYGKRRFSHCQKSLPHESGQRESHMRCLLGPAGGPGSWGNRLAGSNTVGGASFGRLGPSGPADENVRQKKLQNKTSICP